MSYVDELRVLMAGASWVTEGSSSPNRPELRTIFQLQTPDVVVDRIRRFRAAATEDAWVKHWFVESRALLAQEQAP
jgi:hypothetical protein